MEHYKLLKGDDKELTSQTDFSKLPQLPKVNDPRNIKSKPK